MRKIIVFASFFIAIILIFSSYSFASSNKQVYKSKSNEDKKIALTFDDGPHPKKTKEIVEILEKYGITATFFVVGINVKNYPKTMDMLLEKGYEIGNHTYSHRILKKIGKINVKNEIDTTEEEIINHNGEKTKYIRPPCGEYDDNLINLSIENDYKIVLWNIDTKDWMHETKSNIVKNVMSRVKGGDIILFHDYTTGKNNTVEALDDLIPRLIDAGYEFVSISELLQ